MENNMKICVTSQGTTLDAEIDPRFGRCAYFIIVNLDNMEFEAIKNDNALSAGGAGTKAGQLLAEKNVSALLTGNVGPNAFEALHAAEIKIYTQVKGKVSDAIKRFQNNEFQITTSNTVNSHSGMNI